MKILNILPVYQLNTYILRYICRQQTKRAMALAIKTVPVLKGKPAERFVKNAQESYAKKGTVDFSKEASNAKKILATAKL